MRKKPTSNEFNIINSIFTRTLMEDIDPVGQSDVVPEEAKEDEKTKRRVADQKSFPDKAKEAKAEEDAREKERTDAAHRKNAERRENRGLGFDPADGRRRREEAAERRRQDKERREREARERAVAAGKTAQNKKTAAPTSKAPATTEPAAPTTPSTTKPAAPTAAAPTAEAPTTPPTTEPTAPAVATSSTAQAPFGPMGTPDGKESKSVIDTVNNIVNGGTVIPPKGGQDAIDAANDPARGGQSGRFGGDPKPQETPAFSSKPVNTSPNVAPDNFVEITPEEQERVDKENRNRKMFTLPPSSLRPSQEVLDNAFKGSGTNLPTNLPTKTKSSIAPQEKGIFGKIYDTVADVAGEAWTVGKEVAQQGVKMAAELVGVEGGKTDLERKQEALSKPFKLNEKYAHILREKLVPQNPYLIEAKRPSTTQTERGKKLAKSMGFGTDISEPGERGSVNVSAIEPSKLVPHLQSIINAGEGEFSVGGAPGLGTGKVRAHSPIGKRIGEKIDPTVVSHVGEMYRAAEQSGINLGLSDIYNPLSPMHQALLSKYPQGHPVHNASMAITKFITALKERGS